MMVCLAWWRHSFSRTPCRVIITCSQTRPAAEPIQLELISLQERLEAQDRRLFGTSSERRSSQGEDAKDDNHDEANHGKNKHQSTSKKPRRGHGPTPQLSIPVVEEIHDLDEADKICPACGMALNEITNQFEEAEEIAVIQRSYQIVKHKRKKYTCPQGCCIETAPGPLKLIPGGRYSIDFAVDVAINKYADHLPLHRQSKIMQRHGIIVQKQTLWDQIWALSRYLKPTWEALFHVVLSAAVIGADETTWRMLKGKCSKWYVWAIASSRAVYFMIRPSRNAKVAIDLLGDYKGTVMVDGYQSYRSAQNTVREKASDDVGLTLMQVCGVFTLVYCWCHVRRKFIESESHYPAATELIDLIGELYTIEAKAKEVSESERLDYLARLRQGIVDTIQHWLQIGTGD